MPIMKSTEEIFVVDGNREDLLSKCKDVLEDSGFKDIEVRSQMFQVLGRYHRWGWPGVYGDIQVTLIPEGNNTKVLVKASAGMDNIGVLFKDPRTTILEQFKKGWES